MTDNKIKRDWLIKLSQPQFYIQLVYKPQVENMNFSVWAAGAAGTAGAARAVVRTGAARAVDCISKPKCVCLTLFG